VSGRPVELRIAGTGDPLLFLHGWGLTPRTYTRALDELCASGLQVLAPCLPGFGASAPLGLSAGLAAHAEVIADLLDDLNPEKPCFVVGHSFGGGVALRLAVDRPDLVRSVTVINTVGGAPGSGGLVPGNPLRWLLGALGEFDPRDWLRSPVAPRVAVDLAAALLRRPAQSAATALVALTANLRDDVESLVESDVPTLFVWGETDRLIAPGRLGQLPVSLTSRTVPGRHSWLLLQPREFAELVIEALQAQASLEWRRRGRVAPAGLPSVPAGAAGSLAPAPEVSGTLVDLFPAERRHRARHQPYPAGGTG
jgi:pimeloyl-ACP methyl ester carboxylesterase